jgi:formylglycine-generating enzyme required for sulfatase activity
VVLAVAAAAAIVVSSQFGNYFAREHLIQSNMGTIDLVIVPFDWVGGAPVQAGFASATSFALSAYEAQPDDLTEPGAQLHDELISLGTPLELGVVRTRRVRAPGGTVFLRIDGRGRGDERCAPSWVRIQSFPGYRTDDVRSVVLWVPTCQATFADMIAIEKGPFVYGGTGEPRSRHFGEPDFTETEQIINLGGYAIDRTEVSNAAFLKFGELEKVTGYPAPVYARYGSDNDHTQDGAASYPVSSVDAVTAKAYCAYMGKRLPSDPQWVKAARGGLTVAGMPNRYPRRLYPWGPTEDARLANLKGDADGYAWTSPVDAFPHGASPYGVLNLVGNVQEWIARDGQSDINNPLHVLRGGFPDAAIDEATTLLRNHRAPKALYYSNGLRCVVPDKDVSP